jgi:hypothetical protein
LHQRADELIAHHEERCAMIAEACAKGPKTAADLVPVIFHRALDPHQMSFAFSEVLAHVNYMVREGDLVWVREGDGIDRVAATTIEKVGDDSGSTQSAAG